MDLVLVEWLDAHSGRGWQTIEQLESAAEPLRCRSVGWLVRRTRECVVIASHISGAEQAEQGATISGQGDMMIPRVAITRIRKLRQP